MVVGINYKDDGSRIIALLEYSPKHVKDKEILDAYKYSYDEVYVVDSFNPNDQSFIDIVVTQGCRL